VGNSSCGQVKKTHLFCLTPPTFQGKKGVGILTKCKMFDRFWLDYWGKTLIGFDLIIEGKLRKPIHGHILNRFWKVVSSSFKWTYSIQISFLCFDCQGKTSHPNTEYPLKLNNKYSRHWFFEGETPFSIGGRGLNVILYLWLLHLGIRRNIPRGHGILPEGFYTPKTLIYLYIYMYIQYMYGYAG